MQSPCGMLLSAVSNWPASAASRKLEVSAFHEDRVQAEVDALQADEEQHEQSGKGRGNRNRHAAPSASDIGPHASRM